MLLTSAVTVWCKILCNEKIKSNDCFSSSVMLYVYFWLQRLNDNVAHIKSVSQSVMCFVNKVLSFSVKSAMLDITGHSCSKVHVTISMSMLA